MMPANKQGGKKKEKEKKRRGGVKGIRARAKLHSI
jgi:hypothetical protein